MSDIAPLSSSPIQSLTGVGGVGAPASVRPSSAIEASPRAPRTDSIEISFAASMMQRLRDTGDVRLDKVEAARQALARGTYDAPEMLDRALDEMINDALEDQARGW